MVDETGDQAKHLVDPGAVHPGPAFGAAQVNAGVHGGGPAGGMMRQYEGQRPVHLAVGLLVVHPGVADMTAAVGVNLG